MADKTIDGIESAILLLMEVDDYSSPRYSELLELLNELSEGFREQGISRAVEALKHCERLMSSQADFGETVQQISQTVTCLQDFQVHGKSIEEITFPHEQVDDQDGSCSEGIDINELIQCLSEEGEEAEEVVEKPQVEQIADKVNLAVLKLMEVDSFGSPEAQELIGILDELAEYYTKQGESRPSVAISICIGQIGTESDYGTVVKQISRTLNCLQEVLSCGVSLEEITFPNEEPSEPVIASEEAFFGEEDEEASNQENAPVAKKESPQDPILFTGDPELLDLFIQDATEHLGHVESDLMVLEENPKDSNALDAAFRSFHSVKGAAGFAQLVPIEKIAHAMEELLDLARDGKLTLQGKIMDLILGTLDSIRVWVQRVEVALEKKAPMEFTSEGEEFIVQIRSIVDGTADHTQIVVPERLNNKSVDSAEAEKEEDSTGGEQSAEAKAKSASRTEAVRVDRHRLDELIDLIGELVISESMVSADYQKLQNGQVEGKAHSQLRKITRELQELSLSLRMMSINGLFQKGKRVVRDLSRKLGKPINLVIEGAETELDKSILDELSDPLVHLIRNSVDHGVESSLQERTSGGKPETATITLRAFYQGGNIYVEIEDDGRGLSREKLLTRAIDRGIISPDADLTDEQVHHLIFEPGFSTAEKVTEVSGRGVGMDVVRRNIEALRGSVSISSEFGKGTCISLRLPLTLAIIDGMVVRVQNQRYIIPTLSIVNQLRPEADALSTVNGSGEIVAVRGKNIPYHRLARVFSLTGEEQEVTESTIILIEEKDRLAGLLVDEVIGQQQVVIKSLGATLSDSSVGIAGAAVMPDGEIGLILDIHGVLELARGTRAK